MKALISFSAVIFSLLLFQPLSRGENETLIGEWAFTSPTGFKAVSTLESNGDFRLMDGAKVLGTGKWKVTGSTLQIDTKAGATIFTLPVADGKLQGKSTRGTPVTMTRDSASAAPAAGATKDSGIAGIAPSQFIGKTFAACEGILGKPVKTEKIEGSGQSSFYKGNSPEIAQIQLRGTSAEAVDFVRYFFPKEKIKTLGEAFASTGISTKAGYIAWEYRGGEPTTPKNCPRVLWRGRIRSLDRLNSIRFL